MTQTALAKALGISAASVSAWKEGKTRPEAHFRQAIERLLAIPADDWMTAAERAIASGAKAEDDGAAA